MDRRSTSREHLASPSLMMGALPPYDDGGSAPIPPPLPPHRFAMLPVGPHFASLDRPAYRIASRCSRRGPILPLSIGPPTASLRDAPGGAAGLQLPLSMGPTHASLRRAEPYHWPCD